MGTSRNILFFAEEKSSMIKFIIKTVKKIAKEKNANIYDYGDTQCYGSVFYVHENGESPDYFGGDKLMKKYPDLKLWVDMGGLNMTFYDNGKKYSYPVPYFNKLLAEIKKSKIKNDVYILCYNDIGGEPNKMRPEFIKAWTGFFI